MKTTLGALTASEARKYVGRRLLCRELGGLRIMAVLRKVDGDENDRIRSVTVDEGDATDITWPTQWVDARRDHLNTRHRSMTMTMTPTSFRDACGRSILTMRWVDGLRGFPG